VSPERPINADVPAPEAPEEEKPKAPKPKAKPEIRKPAPSAKPPPEAPKPTKPAKQPKPLAPKLLAGLVAVAIVFIVAAVIGGTGGGKNDAESDSATPTPQLTESTGLGFPLVATGNTTRVGGADPASNAAAVALATFPSTTAAQRPAAVTLVGEEDWAAAIAAAVLMAPPVRAPILFSASGDMPEASAEAMATLAPEGSGATDGAATFVVGGVAGGTGKVTDVPSRGAAAAAAAIAELRDRLDSGPPKHIVIAPEDAPEFAMPAAAWAARSGDPVLFAAGDDLPAPTADYLEKHTELPIYVLGPPSALSAEIVREADAIGGEVARVAGEDPVANAIAFARYSDDGFGWNINDPGHGFVLARDDSPLEAAAAVPLSASGTWGPLLLTDSADTLPSELRDYFLDVKPGYTDNPTRAFYNHVWVIGDQEAIDLNQQAEVNELAELAKIGGAQ